MRPAGSSSPRSAHSSTTPTPHAGSPRRSRCSSRRSHRSCGRRAGSASTENTCPLTASGGPRSCWGGGSASASSSCARRCGCVVRPRRRAWGTCPRPVRRSPPCPGALDDVAARNASRPRSRRGVPRFRWSAIRTLLIAADVMVGRLWRNACPIAITRLVTLRMRFRTFFFSPPALTSSSSWFESASAPRRSTGHYPWDSGYWSRPPSYQPASSARE